MKSKQKTVFVLFLVLFNWTLFFSLSTMANENYGLDLEVDETFYVKLTTLKEDKFESYFDKDVEDSFGPGAKEGYYCKYQISEIEEDDDQWKITFLLWEWESKKEDLEQKDPKNRAELSLEKDPTKNEEALPDNFKEFGFGYVPNKVEDYLEDVDWVYALKISEKEVCCGSVLLNQTAEFDEKGTMKSFQWMYLSEEIALLEFEERGKATNLMDLILPLLGIIIAAVFGVVIVVVIKKKRSKAKVGTDKQDIAEFKKKINAPNKKAMVHVSTKDYDDMSKKELKQLGLSKAMIKARKKYGDYEVD